MIVTSNCCGESPIGELDEHDGHYFGRCDKCKEMAEFLREDDT